MKLINYLIKISFGEVLCLRLSVNQHQINVQQVNRKNYAE